MKRITVFAVIALIFFSIALTFNSAKAEDIGHIYFSASANDAVVGLVGFKDRVTGRIWTAIDELKKINGIVRVSTIRNDPPILRNSVSGEYERPLACPLTIEKDNQFSWDKLQPKVIEVCKNLIFSGQKVIVTERKE